MLLYFLLLLVIISMYVAFTSWRRGIFLMILVGAVQDPIRKLTPGTPGYIVLATVPIFAAMVFGASIGRVSVWNWFRRSHRRLSVAIYLFLFSLVPATVVTASYGFGSVLLIFVGLLSYLTLIYGWVIGNVYIKKPGELRRILAFYCIVTSIMLIGTPLEYFNVLPNWLALGTQAMNMEWIKYVSWGHTLKLISGFYRSPDIMGWHAVLTTMIAAVLAMSGRGGKRAAWIMVAAWAMAAAMLSGRRKMVMMLPLFGMVLVWFYYRVRYRTRVVPIVGMLIGTIIVGYTVYDFIGSDSTRDIYYFHQIGDIPQRVKSGGYDAVRITIRQSGFFGQGLGTASTGGHHVAAAAERPRTWQEGGLDKLTVELGVPGLVLFLVLSYRLTKTILEITRRLHSKREDFALMTGLGAIFFANAGSFIVSHQVFGDPYVLTFFSFLTGILLSSGRLQLPIRHRGAADAALLRGRNRLMPHEQRRRPPGFRGVE